VIDALFLIFVTIYLWISIKVENWITLYYLGFKSETPPLFLKNQRIYDVARIILILICIALAFNAVLIPWFICLLIIAFIWVLSGKIGRNKAFNKYREIIIELAEQEMDEQQKSEYTEESKKSNHFLQDKVTKAIKLGL